MSSKLTSCGQIAKKYDSDRFLLSLFASEDVRPVLWAIIAFNHEVAKTREIVTETQLGHIRLQWWREEINKIYTNEAYVPQDILIDLEMAIKTYALPQDLFERLIYAREFDLEDVVPQTTEGLLNYIDFTNTPLLKLMSIVVGADVQETPIHPIALNYGLCGIIRSAPFHSSQGRCYVPQDQLDGHGVSLNSLYKGQPEDGIKSIGKELIEDHFLDDLKPDNRFLKAVNKLSKLYRHEIKKAKYDPFAPRLLRPLPFKALRLALNI